jgi:hypothetical protein
VATRAGGQVTVARTDDARRQLAGQRTAMSASIGLESLLQSESRHARHQARFFRVCTKLCRPSWITLVSSARPETRYGIAEMSERVEFEAAGLLDGVEEGAARDDRLRLLEDLAAAGFSVDELQEAAAAGRLALLHIDRALRKARPCYTPIQVAEHSGFSLELLRRLWRALGLAEADDAEIAFDESDLEAAKTVGQFHAAGLDDASLVLISR